VTKKAEATAAFFASGARNGGRRGVSLSMLRKLRMKSPETFDDVVTRFPVLDVVIRNLNCNDADKKFLRELFLEVYRVAVDDTQRQYEELL
jgi:hypothetical protein